MDNYEIGLARTEVDNFFWRDFCDYYLEIVKERLYNENNKYGNSCLAAKKTLAIVFLEILKMYSPFVPHITEYIYQNLYKKEKEQILSCSIYKELPCNKEYLEFGEFIKELIFRVRKYKSDHNLSMKEPIDTINISTKLDNIKLLKDSIGDICSCTKASNINVQNSAETFIEIVPYQFDDTGKRYIKKIN